VTTIGEGQTTRHGTSTSLRSGRQLWESGFCCLRVGFGFNRANPLMRSLGIHAAAAIGVGCGGGGGVVVVAVDVVVDVVVGVDVDGVVVVVVGVVVVMVTTSFPRQVVDFGVVVLVAAIGRVCI